MEVTSDPKHRSFVPSQFGRVTTPQRLQCSWFMTIDHAFPSCFKPQYESEVKYKVFHKYVNYDHPGECSPEKDCLW